MTSPIVETDLGKVLERINQNLTEFRQEANQNLAEFRKETNQNLAEFRKETNQNLAEFRQEANQNLAEFRKETNQRFDKINERLTNLEIGEARLEEELKGEIKILSVKVDNVDKQLEDVKTSQKAQSWTLIGILATAVMGILVAGGKVLFFPGNP